MSHPLNLLWGLWDTFVAVCLTRWQPNGKYGANTVGRWGSLSSNAFHACVYIYIQQLRSFRVPMLWFINLTVPTCLVQYIFLSLCQFFQEKMNKTWKYSKSAIFVYVAGYWVQSITETVSLSSDSNVYLHIVRSKEGEQNRVLILYLFSHSSLKTPPRTLALIPGGRTQGIWGPPCFTSDASRAKPWNRPLSLTEKIRMTFL